MMDNWRNHIEKADQDFASTLPFDFEDKEFPNLDAVFLAGGGQDSAAALHHFCKNAMTTNVEKKLINIYPMYVDYGQLVKLVEIAAILEQSKVMSSRHVKIHPLRVFTDPLKQEIIGSNGLLTGGDKSAYIEYRNIRYLTTAAAYASLKNCTWLIAGLAPAVMSIDSGYAASLATQIALNQNVLNLEKRVRLYAPIVQIHRSLCVRYLHEVAEDTGIHKSTFSCYTPNVRQGENELAYIPCGQCLSCQVRIGGHRLSGHPDPTTEWTVTDQQLLEIDHVIVY